MTLEEVLTLAVNLVVFTAVGVGFYLFAYGEGRAAGEQVGRHRGWSDGWDAARALYDPSARTEREP